MFAQRSRDASWTSPTSSASKRFWSAPSSVRLMTSSRSPHLIWRLQFQASWSPPTSSKAWTTPTSASKPRPKRAPSSWRTRPWITSVLARTITSGSPTTLWTRSMPRLSSTRELKWRRTCRKLLSEWERAWLIERRWKSSNHSDMPWLTATSSRIRQFSNSHWLFRNSACLSWNCTRVKRRRLRTSR